MVMQIPFFMALTLLDQLESTSLPEKLTFLSLYLSATEQTMDLYKLQQLGNYSFTIHGGNTKWVVSTECRAQYRDNILG
jgi:hypothetical protein